MNLYLKLKGYFVYQPKIVVIGSDDFFVTVSSLITNVSNDISIHKYLKTDLNKIKKHNFKDSVITIVQNELVGTVTMVMCCDVGSVNRKEVQWSQLQEQIRYGIMFYKYFMTAKTRDTSTENRFIAMACIYMPGSSLEVRAVDGKVFVSGVLKDSIKLDVFYKMVKRSLKIDEIFDHNLLRDS